MTFGRTICTLESKLIRNNVSMMNLTFKQDDYFYNVLSDVLFRLPTNLQHLDYPNCACSRVAAIEINFQPTSFHQTSRDAACVADRTNAQTGSVDEKLAHLVIHSRQMGRRSCRRRLCDVTKLAVITSMVLKMLGRTMLSSNIKIAMRFRETFKFCN